MMSGAQICVIRNYHPKDQSAVTEIIQEAVMEKCYDYCIGIVFSSAFIQIAVLLTAILFIVFGVPLQFALVAFPLTVGILCGSVYLCHLMKSTELSDDLGNINANYMRNDETCFFVAEVYVKIDGGEIYTKHSKKVKKVEYEFVTEKEFEVKSFNLTGLTPIVAGCIAITQSFQSENRAHIRRFAVLERFRRRQLGRQLIKTAIAFSKGKKFAGVQAIITEYHREGFELFVSENFDLVPTGYKSLMMFSEVKQISVYLSFAPKKNQSTDEDKSKLEANEKVKDLY